MPRLVVLHPSHGEAASRTMASPLPCRIFTHHLEEIEEGALGSPVEGSKGAAHGSVVEGRRRSAHRWTGGRGCARLAGRQEEGG